MTKTQTPVRATLWSLMDRFSSQAIAFVIGIVLARLLSPYDYGVVGLISIFLALSNVFIDSGFGNGLIRKIDRNEDDFSTAFYFNVGVGIIIYIILWLCSPLIAWYFEEPILIELVRICGLNVIFNSFCLVQTAILTIHLNIRLQTIISICTQLPAGIIAIFMAYKGLGVYALALQTVIATLLRVILLWYYAKWRPQKSFSIDSFKYLWGFGSKLLGASLIGSFFNQIYSILIGKYIGKNELGYYTKSAHLKDNVTGITSGIITKVALPVLAKYQNSPELLCEKYREVMRLLVILIAPLSACLCFASEDIIVLLWSEKWLNSALLFQLLIVGSMFNPIGDLSLILLQVIGRTGLILKLEFPKKAVYCVLIAVGFMYGVVGLCVSVIAISVVAACINMYATKKVIQYSYFSQLIDILKYMLVAYGICCLVSLLPHSNMHILNIMVTFLMSSILYIVTLVALRDTEMLKLLLKVKSSFLR